MTPIKWLCNKAPGFSDLSLKERNAIMHFALLWSFFEAEALKTNATANRILALTREWESSTRLRIEPFAECISYFRERYFKDGSPTEYFTGLNLRNNDTPALVSAVLKCENTNQADVIAVILIVVFRLRNNLFHGVKWAYGIRGQLPNFTHANIALMAALDMVECMRR